MVLGSLLGLLSTHIGMIPVELGPAVACWSPRCLLAGTTHGPGNRRIATRRAMGVFGVRPDRVRGSGLLAGHAAFAAMKDQGLALLLCGAVIDP
jgi:putative transport protein